MPVQHEALGLFPLNTVLFPGMTLPLRVFEPRYLQMIDDCRDRSSPRFSDAVFGVTLIKEGKEVGGPAVHHEVGTTARIVAVERKRQGILHVTAVGEERFRLASVSHDRPYLVGHVALFPLQGTDAPEVDTLFDVELALVSAYLELLSQANNVEIRLQHVPHSPEAMAYLVAALLQISLPLKQQLLSIADLTTLLHQEVALLENEITALTIMLRGGEILGEDAHTQLSTN